MSGVLYFRAVGRMLLAETPSAAPLLRAEGASIVVSIGSVAKVVPCRRGFQIAIKQERYSPSLEMAFQITHVLSVPLKDVFQYPHQEGAAS